jgi:hypothetical protein
MEDRKNAHIFLKRKPLGKLPHRRQEKKER